MQALGTALNYVAKTPLERLGQIIDARMSYWHFTNLLTTAEKVRAKLEAKGLRPEQLDPKLREIVPMLEAAKNEDDTSLQDMWVSLLAASLDPASPEAVLPYQEILKSIFPLEAKVLSNLDPIINTLRSESFADYSYQGQVERVPEALVMNVETTVLALRHLEHLGLILSADPEASGNVVTVRSLTGRGAALDNFLRLSRVGRAFLQRCTYTPEPTNHA